jgi:hypothetical protein
MNARIIETVGRRVTGAANEQLDAVNGLYPVTDRPAARYECERRYSAALKKSAGMQ